MDNLDVVSVPVVILAAGEARRLQPLSEQIIKPIVPIVGVPLIGRIIQNFKFNGFKDFIIVISSEEDDIKKYVDESQLFKEDDIKITYVYQNIAKGMGDAILKAEDEVKKHKNDYNSFFLTASDVLFAENLPKNMWRSHIERRAVNTLSLVYSEDSNMANGHGNVELDKNFTIKKIVEKPGADNKISDFYSMPIYIFDIDIFDYLRKVEISNRGEIEVQNALQNMLDNNKLTIGYDIYAESKVKINLKNIGKYHLTYVKDFLAMNLRFLQGEGEFKFKGEYPATIEPVKSAGEVECGDSLLLGPNVFIGNNCKIDNLVEISNSIILDNCTIGKTTIIENSIIGPNVIIQPNQRIENSLILSSMNSDENSNKINKL